MSLSRESRVEETVIDIAGPSNKLPSPNQKAFQAFFRGRIRPDGSPDSTHRQLFFEVFAKNDWTAAQSRCRCSAGIDRASFRAH
jgi:hypothetical protein